MALPQTATDTVLVDLSLSYSGSMTLTVYNLPPDFTGAITSGTPGQPVLVSTDTPGQNGRLTVSPRRSPSARDPHMRSTNRSRGLPMPAAA